MICTWLVTAPVNKLARVSFKDLFGYLTVRDGKNISSVVLFDQDVKYNSQANIWTSSGQYLWIRYKTNRQPGRICE